MNNLKTLRKSNKMTLREVRELANMPHSLVSEIENGRRKMSPRHASLLAPIFGVTEVYLMGDDAIRLDIPVTDFMKDTLSGMFDALVSASVADKLDTTSKLVYTLLDLVLNSSFNDEELQLIIEFVEKLKGDH